MHCEEGQNERIKSVNWIFPLFADVVIQHSKQIALEDEETNRCQTCFDKEMFGRDEWQRVQNFDAAMMTQRMFLLRLCVSSAAAAVIFHFSILLLLRIWKAFLPLLLMMMATLTALTMAKMEEEESISHATTTTTCQQDITNVLTTTTKSTLWIETKSTNGLGQRQARDDDGRRGRWLGLSGFLVNLTRSCTQDGKSKWRFLRRIFRKVSMISSNLHFSIPGQFRKFD